MLGATVRTNSLKRAKTSDKIEFEKLKQKYQNEKQCCIKKGHFWGTDTRWYQFKDREILLFKSKSAKTPYKTIPIHDIVFEERPPLSKEYQFSVFIKSSIIPDGIFLHLKVEEEKRFVVLYLKLAQLPDFEQKPTERKILETPKPNEISTNQLIQKKVVDIADNAILDDRARNTTTNIEAKNSLNSRLIQNQKQNEVDSSSREKIISVITERSDEQVPDETDNQSLQVRHMKFKMQNQAGKTRPLSADSSPINNKLQVPRKFENTFDVIGPHINPGLLSPASKFFFDDVLNDNIVDNAIAESKDFKKGSNKIDREKLVSPKLKETLYNFFTDTGNKQDNENLFNEELKKIKTVEECIKHGQEYMWSYQIPKAKKCYSLLKHEDSLLDLLRIECNMLDLAVTGNVVKIKEVLNELTTLSDQISDLSFSQKDDLNRYFSNELNKAEIAIYKCGMNLFLGNKFQTFKYLTEAYRQYKRLESISEKKGPQLSSRNRHRYRFGYGCFNLAFSLIPPTIMRFIRWIGVTSDKEAGLKALDECREHNEIRSGYSTIVLVLYLVEFEVVSDKACDHLRESIQKWPRCPFFYWLGSILAWKFCQARDAYYMIKTAFWMMKESSKHAVFLLYELGWVYFIHQKWEEALKVFQQIVTYAFPRKFFQTQNSEIQSLASSLKPSIKINLQAIYEDLTSVDEEKVAILPHLPQLSIKIASCYFQLQEPELGKKWLLLSQIIHKKYSNFKSKPEEDFSKLAIKFLYRESTEMLPYEIYYFMRYLPKLPDELLRTLLDKIEDYRHTIQLDQERLRVLLARNNKTGEHCVIEYFSSHLLSIITNCLLGETTLACSMFEEIKPFLSLIPEDYSYFIPHLEYWIGRAYVADEKVKEAKEVLKYALKRKKSEFLIVNKIKKALSELE